MNYQTEQRQDSTKKDPQIKRLSSFFIFVVTLQYKFAAAAFCRQLCGVRDQEEKKKCFCFSGLYDPSSRDRTTTHQIFGYPDMDMDMDII